MVAPELLMIAPETVRSPAPTIPELAKFPEITVGDSTTNSPDAPTVNIPAPGVMVADCPLFSVSDP
jgi:hypothetical protein